MEIYKLGCKWGRKEPIFYDMIKKRGIIISHIGVKLPYPKRGDIIIITIGKTVRAITELLGDSKPVTIEIDSTLKDDFDKYKIPYVSDVLIAKVRWIPWAGDIALFVSSIVSDVLIAKVRWIQLKQSDWFWYDQIAGIRRVKKQKTIEQTLRACLKIKFG